MPEVPDGAPPPPPLSSLLARFVAPRTPSHLTAVRLMSQLQVTVQKGTAGKKGHANPAAFVVDACPLGHDSCEAGCEFSVPWRAIPVPAA